MDIAAVSIGLNQINLQQQVGIAVENLALSASKQQGNQLMNMLNTPTPHPTLGHNIDLKA